MIDLLNQHNMWFLNSCVSDRRVKKRYVTKKQKKILNFPEVKIATDIRIR